MKNWIRTKRRRWASHWVIYHGQRIRQYGATRRNLDASEWPEDAASLDALIDYHERAAQRHLDYLRRSA